MPYTEVAVQLHYSLSMLRGGIQGVAVFLSCVAAFSGTALFGGQPASDVADLLERFDRQENWRAEALRDYEGTRRYVLTGDRFGQNAAMGVRVNYAYPGRKNLQVMWETGSRLLQTRVLRRVVEAELEADGEELRDKVRITAQNYTFRPDGVAFVDSRKTYVFELTPKRKCKFMIRGRVWVDAEDAAVVRVEGEPLSTGSFWVRGVRIVQQFRKVGPFWMLASTRTDANIRFFGPAHLSIDYTDYQVNTSLLAHLSEWPKPE